MKLRVHQEKSRRGRRAVERLLSRGETSIDARVLRSAERIVAGVRKRGDRALVRAVRRFDGHPVQRAEQLRRSPRKEASRALPPGFEAALGTAIESVSAFHRRQLAALEHDFQLERAGLVLEERTIPLRRVGLYVPGGRFPYPSSAVMTAVPARIAGVEEIVVVTPPQALEASPALRHALHVLEVDEVWAMGGAHAIAALAYGTETVRPVDLIAGPGNVWVAAAKRLVQGQVGIDREAGPSEVVIVATGDDPELPFARMAERIAADLLAQAEHDPDAVAVLVTPERSLARAVRAAVKAQIGMLPASSAARRSLERKSCALVAADLEAALDLAEQIAPEHLQLFGAGAEKLAPRVRRAGAIFVGAGVPTVLGDYVAGPSHVLPTGGTARFSSGLGVQDFLRRSHTVRPSKTTPAEGAAAANRRGGTLFEHAATLARVEGLEAHRRSAELRGDSRDEEESS